MVFQNIIHLGASGSLGAPLLQALQSSGRFNVSVLTRESSSSVFPEGVNVVRADYSSHQSLVAALKGQDAAVITFPGDPSLEKIQRAVIDAAVEAGVSHIIPSSFGNDLANEPGRSEPMFAPKVGSETYLRTLASEGKISYTTVYNGAFLDWALLSPGGALLGIDLVKKKATLIDEGTNKVMFTNLDSVCEAVIAILSNPDKFRNKEVRIHDFFVSQVDIVKIAEEELGSKFEVVQVDSVELVEAGKAGLAAGNRMGIASLLRALTWGKNGRVAVWDVDDDSEALGLRRKDLREEIVRVIRKL
ncbi:hypothetical protein C8J56DRAFT_925243 [Mycena floridula]|nr:hypothetical protein C8J56DRAFT_925243 [Mycena floridula]